MIRAAELTVMTAAINRLAFSTFATSSTCLRAVWPTRGGQQAANKILGGMESTETIRSKNTQIIK